MATATARKPRAAKPAKPAKAAANVPAIVAAAPAANVPAIVPGAPTASNLPANAVAMLAVPASTPASLPAAHNGTGWEAMLTSLPAWGEMLAEMRAGKYGKDGKGLIPDKGTMYALTAIGRQLAETGSNKNGKPNVQAATCKALALALAATGESKACKAAVVYYMLTDAAVLATLRASKATKYVGRTGTPCPRWCADYASGNKRHDFFAA